MQNASTRIDKAHPGAKAIERVGEVRGIRSLEIDKSTDQRRLADMRNDEAHAPPRFIVGNGELAVLAQVGADEPSDVTYWGTSSGKPLPEAVRQQVRWTAQQIHPDYDSVLRNWPKTLRLTIPGCGDVLFCHGTSRSETECFTRLTPEECRFALRMAEGYDAEQPLNIIEQELQPPVVRAQDLFPDPHAVPPDRTLAQKDLLEHLQHDMRNWPRPEREMFELYFVEGLEPEEVAMVTAQPLKKARESIASVQRKLREAVLQQARL